jgi:hypothetical protein
MREDDSGPERRIEVSVCTYIHVHMRDETDFRLPLYNCLLHSKQCKRSRQRKKTKVTRAKPYKGRM